jgi:hypothetical protein
LECPGRGNSNLATRRVLVKASQSILILVPFAPDLLLSSFTEETEVGSGVTLDPFLLALNRIASVKAKLSKDILAYLAESKFEVLLLRGFASVG